MNEHREDSTGVTMRDLFFYILRKWRIIVMMGFGCAFFFGACRGVNLSMMIQSDDYIAKENARYEETIEDWEAETEELDREIKNIEKKLKEKEQYQKQSILMAIDPYNSWIASADICISGVPGMPVSVLANIYQSALNNGSICQKLAEEMHIEEKYICEMIRVDCSEYSTENPEKERTNISTDLAVLHVSLIAVDIDMAQKIMDGIITAFMEIRNELNNGGQLDLTNNLTVLNNICMNRVVEELESYQDGVYSTIMSLSDELDVNRKEKGELEKLVYIKPWSPKEVFLSVFKYFLLGGFVGGSLCLILLLVICLCSDKILSADELKRRTDIKVFAMPWGNEKRFGIGIDKWIRSFEQNRQLEFSGIAKKLLELDGDISEYVIWGKLSQERLNELIPSIKNKTVLEMDLLDSWISLLPEGSEEGINKQIKYILLADREKTTYQELNYKLDVIHKLKGQDIMCVLCI